MTMTNIVAGFHTTGIYPLNRSAIAPCGVEGHNNTANGKDRRVSLAERSGLKFIPLCSPARESIGEEGLEAVVFDTTESLQMTRKLFYAHSVFVWYKFLGPKMHLYSHNVQLKFHVYTHTHTRIISLTVF